MMLVVFLQKVMFFNQAYNYMLIWYILGFDAIRQNTALSNAQKLQCLFEKAESLSAREDLLFYLRQQVLRLVAIRRK
jgi:hypothetical protein